ncbi:hypothetical protein THASP1DRAFT_10554, partial [Thamnocephalis sphaerospora]
RQNDSRATDDRYTPCRVRGIGTDKQGMCPICAEAGQQKWFRMKFSAYWYHMNFFHGISSVSGKPHRDPLRVRLTELRDGLCHQCKCWVPMDSPKCIAVNVPMIYWWKHAQR